jgi:predicted TIM-barrel fold metal-dependent hydrolase
MSDRSCQPPDPNTRTPRWRPPPGACDSHCHVFGPAARFPYAPDRAYTPPDAPLAELRRVHSTLGIDRAVIVQASCHGTDNTAMLDAIAASGNAYRGIAIVDGSVTEAELDRLHEGGIRGVRFNFVRHLGGAPDLDVFDAVVGRIARLGWHVVLHLDAEDIALHSARIGALRVPFVIDHMGRVKAKLGLDQPAFRALLDLMHNPLAHIKICGAERVSSAGAPFADAVPFAQTLLAAAPDRVLWGTDWPHPNIAGDMPNDGDLVDLFAAATSDPALQHQVLVATPTRLYWR